MDQALLADWLRVYALPQQTVRLDSTSVSVYQDAQPPAGLIRHGVSKEHRPDLAQFKVMLASLDPLGLPLACQAVPGNRSDDLLYIPAYDAAMRALDTTAVTPPIALPRRQSYASTFGLQVMSLRCVTTTCCASSCEKHVM